MGHNLTWTMGRQLASFDGIIYTYNENGIRTSKTVNGVTTKYYLDGTDITEQTDGINTLHFYYDSSNELIGFNYADNDYFYIKNQQGDITDITNSNGEVVASYTYDPWGKVVAVIGNVVIGELNPFRYRSYYYDSDIEMYYLQSRYYNVSVCRFINCDDVSFIGISGTEIGYNAFAYCENNSVNYSDFYGYAKAWQQLGFKYSNSKTDKDYKKKGTPPEAYNKWLKSGEKRNVNGVSYTKMGVKTTLLSVTYIPKNKTNSYYLSLGGDSTLPTIMLGIAGAALDLSGKAPGLGKILAAISLMNGLKDLMLYSDKKSFKKEMDKGKGVAILEIRISSSSFGGSIATSYRSWDGKGDLYDLL